MDTGHGPGVKLQKADKVGNKNNFCYNASLQYKVRCNSRINALRTGISVPDRDIFVRIQICGSVPLINGSGSCSFRQCRCSSDANKFFFLIFFIISTYFLKVHFNIYIILHKKSLKKPENSRSQGLTYRMIRYRTIFV